MSTKESLALIEAAFRHELQAPDVGEVGMVELLENCSPEHKAIVQRTWAAIKKVDLNSTPVMDMVPVRTAGERYMRIDAQAITAIEAMDHLTEAEKLRVMELWTQDSEKLLSLTYIIALFGKYLRDRYAIGRLRTESINGVVNNFEITPNNAVELALNTFANQILDQVLFDPENIVLSPEAQAARNPMRQPQAYIGRPDFVDD